jgi:hypothetical protein
VKASIREQRLAQLLDTIRTHGGRWTSGRVQNLRRLTSGATQHGPADGRYFTLRTRKDRA